LRIFTVSDIHIDYKENAQWFFGLSKNDFTDDILILAGDVSSNMQTVIKAFVSLKSCFKEVLFIPGNHDIWCKQKNNKRNSFENYALIRTIAQNCGIIMEPAHFNSLTIIPLSGWYDYSFGEPSEELFDMWVDYSACKWPEGYDMAGITKTFIAMNSGYESISNEFLISFSHFVPRIDVMPYFIPQHKKIIFPVLGTVLLENIIRELEVDMHIYGHTHVNNNVTIDGVNYINNAYGYPSEKRITSKRLLKIHEI
jgi:predicted phosphodiesterase